MTRIAPVRLMYNPKVLWFNARDLDIPVDAAVVVNTARGTEYGHLAEPVFEATPQQLSELKTELKEVIRLGTEADAMAAEEAQALSIAAMPAFRELAAEESEEMRPIAVEYLLTCDKAVFYFEAEQRIDFRELVRKLAARLHVRVDMRQIGSRDEARMMGGLGHCGQELCCKRLGGEFCPVSIRMAKEQNLSLNPQKISGVCGKLMCCLRYEYEAYKDFHARSPKVGDMIKTPDGDAKVVDLDVPREILTLQLSDDKKVKVALADMVPPAEEGAKPNEVDAAAWEETMSAVSEGGIFEASYLTDKFTQESQLGSARAIHRESRAAKAQEAQPKAAEKAAQGKGVKDAKDAGEGKLSRRQRSKAKAAEKAAAQNATAAVGAAAAAAKSRRAAAAAAAPAPAAEPVAARRRRRGEARQMDTGTATVSAAAQTAPKPAPTRATQPAQGAVRPGQHSSGLRRPASAGATAAPTDAAPARAPKAEAAPRAKQAPAKGGRGSGAPQVNANPKGGSGSGAAKGGKPKHAAPEGKAPRGTVSPAGQGAPAPAPAPKATDGGRRQPRRRTRIATDKGDGNATE